MVHVAINPEVLVWALHDTERSAEDLQDATGRSLKVVEQWLEGVAEPHFRDLRAIAKLLDRSPFFFALPAPPESSELTPRFRRALSKNLSVDEKAVELSALRWGQRIQATARRLSADDEPFTGPDLPADATAAAEAVRAWLRWDVRQQVTATSKTAAFKALRLSVEDQGVLVALRSADTERFCGYSLADDVVPLIYINKDFDLSSVRSFTLLHELGHILRGSRKVCYGGDTGEEKWCNNFAAAFLLPEAHLRLYFEKQRLAFASAIDTEPVRLVAQRYKCSWHAAAVRLEELKLAPRGVAEHVKRTRPEPPEGGFRPGGGRKTPEIRVDEFGYALTRLVGAAVDDGSIPSLDARRLLNVDGRQLAAAVDLARGARP